LQSGIKGTITEKKTCQYIEALDAGGKSRAVAAEVPEEKFAAGAEYYEWVFNIHQR